MKVLLCCLSALSFLFYASLAFQEYLSVSSLMSKNVEMMSTIERFHETKVKEEKVQILYLEQSDFCDLRDGMKVRVSLHKNGRVEIFESDRPNKAFSELDPFETGTFSIQDGVLLIETMNYIDRAEYKRRLPILELDEKKSLMAFSLINEFSHKKCL